MKTVTPLLIAIALLALAWFGFVEHVAGAANLVMFFTWGVALPIGCTVSNADSIKKLAAKPAERPLKAILWCCRALEFATVGILVWTGATWTGAALLLACLLALYRSDELQKLRSAAPPQPVYYVAHPDGTYSVAKPQPGARA